MKLRALTLTNVRKFGGRKASLTGIGDGLTVVSEANEFGKSTFFDALHALFFQSHTSTAKPVKSLQPHAGGGIAVAAEVDTPEGNFAIEKRFLNQKGATVRDLSRGTVIARDGEAEDWIARLIGEAEQGPAGLLWLRQGVVGLEPADGSKTERDKLAEARRDLMSSVAGEIDQVTGGRRMDRILARCAADFDKIATTTGRPRGVWKEAAEHAAGLRAEHEVLTAQCAELAGALADRARTDDELARLDTPEAIAALERDLAEARKRMASAEAHAAKVSDAEKALRIAELERDRAAEAFKQLVAEEKALAEATVSLALAEERHTSAVATLAEMREAEAAARTVHETAEGALRALRDELAAAERAATARKARAEVEALAKQIVTARGHHEAAVKARARVEANPTTSDALAKAEDAAAEVARLAAAVQARAAALTMTYDGLVRITLNGAEVPAETRLMLGDAAEIGLPGIGRMQLDLPAATDIEGLAPQLAEAREAEAVALAACDAATLAAARAQARARGEAQEAHNLSEELLKVAAPDGIAALETALAVAQERAAANDSADGRAPDEIRAAIGAAEATEAEARQRHDGARQALENARLAATRSEDARDAAAQAREKADGALGPEEDRTERHSAIETAASDTAGATKKATEALAVLRKDAPDLVTEEANFKRAAAAVEAAGRRRATLKERRAELTARIGARAEENVEERRDEIAGELAALDARLARFEAEKDALIRLRTALEAAREGAREAYFGPVQEELKPLLGILHDEAALDWESDTIMPGALRRGGETEAFDTLSGGTQEQIAILTRLAFARLFARRGQHLPIILDDALVYSDDERIVKMFTALNRVAADQQILVFSCRQMAFNSLGGERPTITLENSG